MALRVLNLSGQYPHQHKIIKGKKMQILPRLIRKRDAPAYLGMDEREFNKSVEPRVVAVPIGSQGVAFDRLDLDEWVKDYKASCGYLKIDGQKIPMQTGDRKSEPVDKQAKESTWQQKGLQGSCSGRVRGTSISKSRGTVDFAKALEQAAKKKQNAS